MNDNKASEAKVNAALSAAVKLRNVEDWEGAERILRKFCEKNKEVPAAVNAVLGHMLWQQSKPSEAIPFLRIAARQSARHEGISLGLFHCLYETGRLADALVEGRRFLRCTGVDEFCEYKETVEAVAAELKKTRK